MTASGIWMKSRRRRKEPYSSPPARRPSRGSGSCSCATPMNLKPENAPVRRTRSPTTTPSGTRKKIAKRSVPGSRERKIGQPRPRGARSFGMQRSHDARAPARRHAARETQWIRGLAVRGSRRNVRWCEADQDTAASHRRLCRSYGVADLTAAESLFRKSDRAQCALNVSRPVVDPGGRRTPAESRTSRAGSGT